MARNIIKSIERGGYRYDVEETGDGARRTTCTSSTRPKAIGSTPATDATAHPWPRPTPTSAGKRRDMPAKEGRKQTQDQTKEPHMDLISQYLASPEFAEAIGNVVVMAIMATAAGIDWKIYGRKTRRRTPPSIDTPQRRRRAAQRRTIPAGHIDE